MEGWSVKFQTRSESAIDINNIMATLFWVLRYDCFVLCAFCRVCSFESCTKCRFLNMSAFWTEPFCLIAKGIEVFQNSKKFGVWSCFIFCKFHLVNYFLAVKKPLLILAYRCRLCGFYLWFFLSCLISLPLKVSSYLIYRVKNSSISKVNYFFCINNYTCISALLIQVAKFHCVEYIFNFTLLKCRSSYLEQPPKVIHNHLLACLPICLHRARLVIYEVKKSCQLYSVLRWLLFVWVFLCARKTLLLLKSGQKSSWGPDPYSGIGSRYWFISANRLCVTAFVLWLHRTDVRGQRA